MIKLEKLIPIGLLLVKTKEIYRVTHLFFPLNTPRISCVPPPPPPPPQKPPKKTKK